MGGTLITPNCANGKTKIAVTPIIDEVAGYMDVGIEKIKGNLCNTSKLFILIHGHLGLPPLGN